MDKAKAAFVVLAICSLSLSRVVHAESTCTSGFPTLEQLLTASNETGYLSITTPGQGIFPSLRFTCDGTLMQLIYKTHSQGSPFSLWEEFRVWRKSSVTNDSGVIAEISRTKEAFFRPVNARESLYSINDLNISVQTDDHLGFVALRGLSSMQFWDARNENASNFYYLPTTASSLTNIADTERVPFIPLITAIVSTTSVKASFGSSSATYSSIFSTTSFTPQPSAVLIKDSTVTARPGTGTDVRTILAAAGAVVGAILSCMAVAFFVIWCVRSKRRKASRTQQSMNDKGNPTICFNKSKKNPTDGDDTSLESNPAYNDSAEIQHYIFPHISSNVDQCENTFTEPQVVAGSVNSTSSSVYYSKPEFVSEVPEDNSSVYYSEPFSSHYSPDEDRTLRMSVSSLPPPLPQSRNGDGIVTVINVSYQRILSNESLK